MANDVEILADKIWSALNTIEGSAKSKDQQIEMIKPMLMRIIAEHAVSSRDAALNYIIMHAEFLKKH